MKLDFRSVPSSAQTLVNSSPMELKGKRKARDEGDDILKESKRMRKDWVF